MNQLITAKRAQILHCLVEGNSMRATCRLTGRSKCAVEKLLVSAGKACLEKHNEIVRNLNCKVIEVDEIWSFTYCKQANVPEEMDGENIGDTWTWIALDADSKLIPAWHVGKRDSSDAYWFINDLKSRLACRVQLTSDGHRAYLEAVEGAFGSEIDYAMLIRLYGKPLTEMEGRYSPPTCIGTRKRIIIGKPDRNLISTSYVERENLTIRMTNRRFTRLTNAFSKKVENHKHACAINFFHYNFCRVHQTLRVTPAMEARIADHIWSMEEMAELIG